MRGETLAVQPAMVQTPEKMIAALLRAAHEVVRPMTWREVCEADLLRCLEIQPHHWGDEIVGRNQAQVVWRELIRSRIFNSVVLEAKVGPSVSILGFGASVFVTAAFASEELANPRPGLNSRIIESIASRNSVVLTESSLASANARSPADVVILCGSLLSGSTNAPWLTEAQMLLAFTFVESHIGYPLGSIPIETVSEVERVYQLSSGVFRTVEDFPGGGRSLQVMTRESALAVSGSIAAKLFHYQEPILGLRDTDKELLSEALRGGTDQEIAARVHVSAASIKKRWQSLFDRVEETLPDLLHEPHGRAFRSHRGPQKRHHVLAYVRSRPQELRPYRWMG